jgi:hypothetical protein
MNWSHNDRQRFYIFESHCRWLDAQALAGIDDNMLARGAVAEFLSPKVLESDRQEWMTDARSGLPAEARTIDVIIN